MQQISVDKTRTYEKKFVTSLAISWYYFFIKRNMKKDKVTNLLLAEITIINHKFIKLLGQKEYKILEDAQFISNRYRADVHSAAL